MNILYLITQGSVGGAQRYVLTLARRFPGSAIAVGEQSSNLREAAAAFGVPAIPLAHLRRSVHPYHDLRAIAELVRVLRSRRPDLIHANSSKAGIIAAIAGAITGVPVIYTAHGFVFSEPLSSPIRRVYRFAERVASLWRKKIIAVSEYDRKNALAYRITSLEKIETIYNGIDPVDFFPRDSARTFLQIPQNSFSIGTIANHYRNKGLDILLEAIARITTPLEMHLSIIGNGPERKNLETLIARLGIGQKVTLHTTIPDAARYLKAFDLFVLPSRKEGFPLALLEAMQAGLPIIASGVGGIPEALGQAGIIVDPMKVSLLRQSISELLSSPEKRAQLGAMAHSRSAQFSAEAMVEETRALYQSILRLT